jgi:hypothetical protein
VEVTLVTANQTAAVTASETAEMYIGFFIVTNAGLTVYNLGFDGLGPV